MHWTRYLDDPALSDFVALERAGTRVLLRRGYEGFTGLLGLEGSPPTAAEQVSGGREPHPLVALPTGERVVVRRYRRGGAMRHLNRERYFVGHRAFDELRATERARAAGVRAPQAVAAAERSRGLGYTALLATRWIAGATELHRWLTGHDPAGQVPVLRAAGSQIRAMHAGGIAHPDLNLRNLLVSPGEAAGELAVHLLDFDRARLFDGPVPVSRRASDLRRLERSARKLGSPVIPAGWQALREGYGRSWPLRSALG